MILREIALALLLANERSPMDEIIRSVRVILAVVPLVAVVALGLMSFFYFRWDYKLRMLIIQKGGTPPPSTGYEKLLLVGIVSLFVGVGILIYFALRHGLHDSLLGGIVPTMVGLGIITFYALFGRKRAEKILIALK